jgi:D-alanyl-D-alanine carboxypeptidase (penicillin-binding protein 5/6)
VTGKSSLVNTNKLVRNYNGCTGLKTGSTSLALYNLSASATRDNMSLIAVVMKAPTSKVRFQNASTLLDYGFSNFEYKSLVCANDTIKSVKVTKGISPTVNAIAETDCGTLVSKGNDVNIEQNISIEDNISAPISKGQIIGKVTYNLNGDIVSECNLIASDDISKINFFSMNKLIFGHWLNLLRT